MPKEENLQLKAEKTRLVLSGLSTDYTIAFLVNLDTDDYEIVFYQKTNHAQEMKNVRTFKEYVERYAESVVLPGFKELLKTTLSCADMKKRFETESDYFFSFETIPNAAGLSYFQGHIVKEYSENGHYALLGFRSVDEVVKQERYYKEELRKANEALQHQLDLITHAIPGGIKISNDDEVYSFRYVSEQFATMLGYASPDDLMEASHGSIVGLAHPDDLETGLADALDQYSRSDHYATTYRVRCKDGSYKYIEDRGQKVQSPDGKIEHWNLTLDKNDYMEKSIALESEKRANKTKTDFLSRMSHDMRTPLNGILGLLEICSQHPDDRALVDASRTKAKIAANHLLSLVNDTLELNKLGTSQYSLHEKDFDMRMLYADVETLARMNAESNGIQLFMDGDVLNPACPYVRGYPFEMKRICLNLISNAIKYNKAEGSVHVTLHEIPVDEQTVRHEICVQDTGIGMQEDFIKKIFLPFTQADHGARSTFMGTGLGMPIVKALLDRMDGTIQIESTVDVGTCITVSIPLRRAEKPVSTEKVPLSRKHTNRRLHVLLAEDNELNRDIARFMLEDAGIKVTLAENGQQAVSQFLACPENTFDVLLMDIMMPVLNGLEATKAIRRSDHADAKTVPIFAMTANAFDEDREKTRAAGMNEHFTKPLNMHEVIEKIEEYSNEF